MIEKWRMYLQAQYAPGTVMAYVYDLRRFQAAQGDPLKATMSDVVDFIAEVSDHLAPATIARHLSSLRAFYRWAQQEGLIEESPVSNLKGPRRGERLPRALNEAEVQALLEVDLQPRNRAILFLMLYAGLRLVEVSRLTYQHIDLQAEQIRVLGKGNKERIIPLHPKLKAALGAWMTPIPFYTFLFPGYSGQTLKPRAIGTIINRIGQDAGIDRPISPHMLRHTFATRLLQQGVNLRIIQELLGHANVATTQIYTHIVTGDLVQAVLRL